MVNFYAFIMCTRLVLRAQFLIILFERLIINPSRVFIYIELFPTRIFRIFLHKIWSEWLLEIFQIHIWKKKKKLYRSYTLLKICKIFYRIFIKLKTFSFFWNSLNFVCIHKNFPSLEFMKLRELWKLQIKLINQISP